VIAEREEIKSLIKQLRARYDSVLYTYRAHEKAADRYQGYENCRRVISFILVTLATGSFVLALAEAVFSPQVSNLLVAFVALLAAGVSYAADYFRFEERIATHKKTAVHLRQISLEYESLISDLQAGLITVSEAADQRSEIIARENPLLEIAPRTTDRDYKRAKRSIEKIAKPYSLCGGVGTPEKQMKGKG